MQHNRVAHLPPSQVPVLIVTPKAGKAVDALYDKKQLRLLLMVEGWAMQLLHHVCDRLLVARRSVGLHSIDES